MQKVKIIGLIFFLSLIAFIVRSEEKKCLTMPTELNQDSTVTPKVVEISQVRKVRKGMTYKEVVTILGPGIDVGDGRHILLYYLKQVGMLTLSFASYEDRIKESGEDLLKRIKRVELKISD